MTATRPSRATPARRVSHRRTPARHRLSMQLRVTLAAFVLICCLLGLGAVARLLAPPSNTALTRFDAIIVLGYPADSDGNPTPGQLARVSEGVREYERGVAPRLILTGGATHNHFTEAQVMARSAEAQGIPATALFVEPQARDTIENACFAERIMKAHGWRSAEVVSRASHLPRAGLIFNELPLLWRTHTAPPLEPESVVAQWAEASVEDIKTARYLVWARWRERCQP